MNQQQFIHQFNSNPKYVHQFNKDLFKRSDEDIIYYIKLLYYSIQRQMGVNAYFTIRIDDFKVIEDYDTIRQILSKYQDAAIRKSVKLRGAVDNRFNYIDLKESDLKIIVGELYIEAYDGREMVEFVMAVPRIIDGQYIVLNGNTRQLMFQLVDASTYNNQTSNSKNPMVVYKTNFQPIKVYRNTVTLHTMDNEDVEAVTFDCDTFSKSVAACLYIFAKMGFIRGLQYFGIDGYIYIGNTPPNVDHAQHYVFMPKKNSELFIAVPKFIFDNNHVVQHIVYTIVIESSRKFITYENFFDINTWLEALGRHFSIATSRPKAISVLSSFEMIYDLMSQENTRLGDDDKRDSYSILRWLLYEYSALILKSNLDVYLKRLRSSEYVAYLIAPKLSKAVYALSDMGDRVNIASIKKRILLPFDFLLTEIAKLSIVVYNDTITDCDSFSAIRYSKNGPSAISEGNGNASMPVVYRYLHPTSLGVLDDCASGNSAPGIAGIVCPLAKLYPGGYFKPDYQEPNDWRERLNALIEQYEQETTLKEVVSFRNRILEQSDVPELRIKDYKISEEHRARLLATANK